MAPTRAVPPARDRVVRPATFRLARLATTGQDLRHLSEGAWNRMRIGAIIGASRPSRKRSGYRGGVAARRRRRDSGASR